MITNSDGSITLPPYYANRYRNMAAALERISLDVNELLRCIDRETPNLDMAKNRANDIQKLVVELGFNHWVSLND